MPRIDLHTHTTASDGTFTPTGLVERAAELGLAALAVTDHDTINGVSEAVEAGERTGVEVVTGVELSARHGAHGGFDVLGYLFDPADATFNELLTSLREYRRKRAPMILDRLADQGIDVTMDEVTEHVTGGAVGRPHIARALVAGGHVKTVQQAFDRYIGDSKPAYVPKKRLSGPEAIEAIHAAGGVAVLAHPGFIHPAVLPQLLPALVEAGLDGIEVWYSEHDPTARAHFRSLAERHDLVATGGSDFHGDNKPHIELGEGRGDLEVDYAVLDALRARRRAPA